MHLLFDRTDIIRLEYIVKTPVDGDYRKPKNQRYDEIVTQLPFLKFLTLFHCPQLF